MAKVFYEGDSWLIWDPNDIEKLRNEARVIGSATLTAPNFPQQSKFLGLPIELTSYEAKWCFENGFCKLVKPIFKDFNSDFPDEILEQNFRKITIRAHDESEYEIEEIGPPILDPFKYKVYCDLKQNYWISDASNYGCDFAIYISPPWECHSSAFIWCNNEILDTKKLIQLMRISETARKRLISAHLTPNGNIEYVEFSRYKSVEDLK
ncbi:tRNA-intron endonuclease catalytic domain-like protein [Histomonas meleagridis]|uniref:tRNA-intron endonuclease catalytic domain-like protein n=1 Tax=Histomonas meleagridis TaxID=135588 RepID=UPI00355A9805|nr:tRNA-intron endonuclease catalytic domain-like protein [Histomonas meleagridis]KAH0802352.1 tRNA-intron endonuclease catalytic domain-like protein [Histomonas meleagridis]